MPLPKGRTNNPHGRKKGSENKVNKSTREFLNAFISKNSKRLQRDWDLLEPFQRVQMYEKLLSFSIPKMNSLEIDKLTEQQMDEMLAKIIEQNEK